MINMLVNISVPVSASEKFCAERKYLCNILDKTVWRLKLQHDVKSRKTAPGLHHVTLQVLLITV